MPPSPRVLAALACLAACTGAPQSPVDAPPEVPDGVADCEPVAEWDPAMAEAERALVDELNALRAEGGTCGALRFAPAPPLRLDPTLRCAARLHTADMVARDYLSPVDPDGVTTGDRLGALGYAAASFAEAVTAVTEASEDPADDVRDAIAAWRGNATSCWMLRARELTAVGVGAQLGEFEAAEAEEPTPALYWTLTLAAPP